MLLNIFVETWYLFSEFLDEPKFQKNSIYSEIGI